MALFRRKRETQAVRTIDPNSPPQDPSWARNQRGKFHRLVHFEPRELGLGGKTGVYVIWHSGVAPRWVWVDRTPNLAQTLEEIQHEDDVMFYERNGGLYVTWAMILTEFQDGVVRYLHEQMKPEIDNPDVRQISVPPIPVLVPGAKAATAAGQAPA